MEKGALRRSGKHDVEVNPPTAAAEPEQKRPSADDALAQSPLLTLHGGLVPGLGVPATPRVDVDV
jgi:hypothetical protein